MTVVDPCCECTPATTGVKFSFFFVYLTRILTYNCESVHAMPICNVHKFPVHITRWIQSQNEYQLDILIKLV